MLLVTSFCRFSLVYGDDAHLQLNGWIDAIRSISKEGQGNRQASAALKVLSGQSSDALIPILKGMSGASPLAQNWLRSSIESIVQRVKKGDSQLPLMDLTEFLFEEANAPRARSLCFEFIQSNDPQAGEILLRGMLNDPSNELRSQAVQQWIQAGEKALSDNKPATAKVILRQALQYARDIEQIRTLADALEEMGHPVYIPDLLGFITDWKVVGPFHNLERSGFDTVFAPENELQFDASYEGKNADATWGPLVSEDRFGLVDINKAYPGYVKEVTAYTHHAFVSEKDRDVQLRLGCKNAWKIWINGEFIFGRDEYHRGMKIDQYILNAHFRAGRNDILVKICQNEQVEDWTIEWEFQLRVCDETGKAIHSLARK